MTVRPYLTLDQVHLSRKPDQQGKFDGLCGVYSILNSVKWLYRLPEKKLDIMFRKLCESLPKNKFPAALFDGLGVPEMKEMLRFTTRYLAEEHAHRDFDWGMPFMRRRFRSVESFWKAVETEIEGGPSLAIIGLNEPWDHWTVARGVTGRKIDFFDSYGMRRYPFSSFTLNKLKAGEKRGQKILIDTHQSFRLTRIAA